MEVNQLGGKTGQHGISVKGNHSNRATKNNTKDYKSVPQGHKKTPIS